MAGKVREMNLWRKMILMITLAFALVIFSDGLATIVRAEAGTTNTAVNMRKTPSKNGDLVKKLEQGTAVELGNLVDGKDGDGKKWYEVTVGGTSGYIRSDLVTKGAAGGNSDGGAQVTGEVEQVTPVGASIAGSNTVRVRTSASTTTSNNILATVAKGTEVTVIGKTVGSDKKTWYQVKLTVEGREVAGYVRSDYLVINGDVKPIGSETGNETQTTDPVETNPTETETKTDTETKVTPQTHGYAVKEIEGEWWLQDLDKNEQYRIEQIFSAATQYKEKYEAADKKAKGRKGWLIFFIILTILSAGCAAYLLFRLKEIKEEAFIASIENNTPRRTAERPRQSANGKPSIKDGLEPRRREGERPANGQRAADPRQGQRPAQPGQQRPTQPGQRPAQPGQQRPAQPGQQRPTQPGQGQRPVDGQRPVQPGQQRPAQPGQRPADGQRPMQQGQRPTQPGQGQRPMDGQRPAQPTQRPVDPQMQRPAQPQAAPTQAPARPKNFAQDDDMEFEFLNWDSDE